jgi:hypothetical protein
MFKKQHVVSVLDVSQFLQLLTDAVYEKNGERIHAACDRLEEFLSNAGTEVRDMVAVEMFESFQNAEYPYGSDIFAWCLGPQDEAPPGGTRSHLETSVELDLQDRTVLEWEILISRIVRQISLLLNRSDVCSTSSVK